MFNGASTAGLRLHVGLCLVPDADRAWEYARQVFGEMRYVHEVGLDLAGLTVAAVAGYDHDENYTPSDWAAAARHRRGHL